MSLFCSGEAPAPQCGTWTSTDDLGCDMRLDLDGASCYELAAFGGRRVDMCSFLMSTWQPVCVCFGFLWPLTTSRGAHILKTGSLHGRSPCLRPKGRSGFSCKLILRDSKATHRRSLGLMWPIFGHPDPLQPLSRLLCDEKIHAWIWGGCAHSKMKRKTS